MWCLIKFEGQDNLFPTKRPLGAKANLEVAFLTIALSDIDFGLTLNENITIYGEFEAEFPIK